MFNRPILLILFAVLHNVLVCQNIVQAGREANFVNYSTQEGIPSNEVLNTYESKNGYLWICSRNGVTRFDGINFEAFTEKNGLNVKAVTSACEDAQGNMWFGTSDGLYILKNNKFIPFDTSLNLPRGTVRGISKFKDGTFWVSANSGVFHVNPNDLKKPLIKKYLPNENKEKFIFRNVWQNKKGEIIAGCDFGCFYLRNDSLVRYNNLTTAAYRMVEFEDGIEWFCAWQQPIKIFKDRKPQGQIDLGSGTLDIIKDKKGAVWVATWDRGIYKYDGKRFINYSVKEGLGFNSFWGITEDSNGNIWFSSWGAGIFKYSGERFTKLSEKSGLASSSISWVTQAPDGKVWISTEQSISSYNPYTGEIKNFTECNGKKLSFTTYLYAKSADEIWCLGYLGKGYKIISNKITEVEDLAGFDIEKDEKGDLWIATDDSGLVHISAAGKKSFNSKDAHGTSRVVSIFRDKTNKLWLINDQKGISLFYNNDIINLNKKNGFFDEYALSIAQDNEGFYWISVSKKGVYKCTLEPGNKIKLIDSLTISNGLVSDFIIGLVIHKNTLVMGSMNGLMTYDLNQKAGGIKNIRSFGKEDGLINLDCIVHFVDKDGKVWLTTPKALYCFNPSDANENKKQTTTHITKIKLFFETPDWLKYCSEFNDHNLPLGLILPYQKNHLTFSFIGINTVAPTKVLYKYKLEGLDEKWSPAGDKREATYSNIPPGTYTFMVKSCNNDGVWNTEPTCYSFTIKPPFWKTVWFYVICALAIILTLYSFIKYREKKLRKEKVILEEKINERTRQLKEAFDQIEVKNREITDSINYASKIQSALMPNEPELKTFFRDCFVFFKPKDIVSGDFYWAMQRDERSYIAVCDSTGHGVPGAFMSLLNLNFINEAFNEKDNSAPNEIFNLVRNKLVSSISREGQKDGFDGVLVCYDKKDNSISYSAANNKPILISNNSVVNLATDKMPVGKGELEKSFSLNKIEYKPNDIVYLFTDGFVDQFGGPKEKKFMYKQLEELLLSIHQLPFNEQREIVKNRFNEWKGKLEQVDDVCLIGLRF